MKPSAISLLELSLTIKNELLNAFPESYWVIAEISDYKVNRNGHCYLELIEKQENTEIIAAKCRATIWSNTFRMIRPYFETTTGRNLSEGLKILINVTVEYHEVYGLSLNILDIEPEYTIGDLARQKAETIARLEKEGVMHMNKGLELPLVPQRIAVISSATAAGYKDFIHQLESNPYGYKFHTRLFPAVMQGDTAESSIISALENIFSREHLFEAVAIIRGGGAKSDLHCFNNYWLAANVAQFPLPILTGIGHEQDESIVDMVAHTRLKTPTAVAEFLINRASEFEGSLFDLHSRLLQQTNIIIIAEQYKLANITDRLPTQMQSVLLKGKNTLISTCYKYSSVCKKYLTHSSQIIRQFKTKTDHTVHSFLIQKQTQTNQLKDKASASTSAYFKFHIHNLEILQNTNQYLDPLTILNRGYSLTFLNNKIINESKNVKEGDLIKTLMRKGSLESRVTGIKK